MISDPSGRSHFMKVPKKRQNREGDTGIPRGVPTPFVVAWLLARAGVHTNKGSPRDGRCLQSPPPVSGTLMGSTSARHG
eukprot:3163368-Alexandrium_andersonii.AAC.1